MPVAERDGARIVLAAEYRERELIKQVPGVRWDTTEQQWWLPLSWAACVQLRGVFGAELQVGAELGAWSRAELEARINPCLALRTAEDADALSMLTALRPFQRAGAEFLRTARHALLADEMGLGKTVQAIAALEATGAEAYPALIVCPNSMKRSWEQEFHKWAPGRIVEVAGSTAATRRKAIEALRDGVADVLVMNYEALRYETRLAPYGSVALDEKDRQEKSLNEVTWRSVVADEAHRVKDPRSKQSRALWYVSKDAQQRYALSGTPVANSPEDMWALMRFVAPTEFPAKTRFIERYALQSYNVFGFMEIQGIKGETREELFKILDPRFVRRTRKAVMPQMPDKVYTTRYVEMETKQKKAYEELRKEKLTELEGGILMTGNPLTELTRLMQFASAMGELEDTGTLNENGTPRLQLKLTSPSCKVEALLELAVELGDDRAVVFAESRQLIELAAKALLKAKYTVGQVTGTVPEHERAANVQNFNAGRIKFLLITLGAGGEGLSLPGCNTAIFLQRSFSLVKNAQAEDRIAGIGRGTEGVAPTIIDVVTVNTVESRVAAAMADKSRKAEELVRDEEMVKAWLAK